MKNNLPNLDGFALSELDGRGRLKTFLDQVGTQKQVPTTKKYDEVDYYALLNSGKKYVFEIKVRNLIDKWTGKVYDEILLGENKVKAIDDRISRFNLDGGYYACFFDNYLYLFDTVHTPKRISTQFCPKTTAGYDHTMQEKPVYYFKTVDAFKYEFKNNKWTLISRPKFDEDRKYEAA